MKLTFLGTGDFLPDQSGHNSAFIEFNNTNLFIDFPATNRKGLLEIGKDLNSVENLFITHLHEDHINGIQQLAHYGLISNKKVNLYIAEKLLDGLWLSVREGLRYSYNGDKVLEDYFNVIVIKENIAFEIAGYEFFAIPTNHIPEMVTYGLLSRPFFYYSGDSNVNGEFLEIIEDQVRMIFHDCHLWDLEIKSHASLDDIKKLNSKIKEKIVLMHYHSGYDPENLKNLFEKREKIQIARRLKPYTIK